MEGLDIAKVLGGLGLTGFAIFIVTVLWKKLNTLEEKYEAIIKGMAEKYESLLERYHLLLTEHVKTLQKVLDELEGGK